MPCAGLTAWQALEPAMPLAGKRVLIHGGAGGVGGFAVQVRAHPFSVDSPLCSRDLPSSCHLAIVRACHSNLKPNPPLTTPLRPASLPLCCR